MCHEHSVDEMLAECNRVIALSTKAGGTHYPIKVAVLESMAKLIESNFAPTSADDDYIGDDGRGNDLASPLRCVDCDEVLTPDNRVEEDGHWYCVGCQSNIRGED